MKAFAILVAVPVSPVRIPAYHKTRIELTLSPKEASALARLFEATRNESEFADGNVVRCQEDVFHLLLDAVPDAAE